MFRNFSCITTEIVIVCQRDIMIKDKHIKDIKAAINQSILKISDLSNISLKPQPSMNCTKKNVEELNLMLEDKYK